MASTFTATKAAAGHHIKDYKPALQCIESVYTVTAGAALVINDVIQMLKVPKGARVMEVILAATDLDSNVTPLITLDVGDGDDPDRYIAASTIGQTGGTVRLGSGITTLTEAFTYTADDTIDVLVKAAPATGATTFSIRLTVIYSTDLG